MAVSCSAPAAGQSVWGLKPYRILVLTAFAPEPEFTPRLQNDFMTGLINRTDASIGAAWRMTVVPARTEPDDDGQQNGQQNNQQNGQPAIPPELAREMLAALDSITIESLPKKLYKKFDKIILMTVTGEPDSSRVTLREFDTQTQLGSTIVSQQAWQLAKLCDVAFNTILDGFAPLALIEQVKAGQVKLWLKASSLPPRDPSVQLVAKGGAFRPVIRFEHRDGRPKNITPIQWSYLTVEKVSGGKVDCKLITGLRSPLAGRRRGRVRQLALAVVPPHEPSTLILQTREKQVLPGYDVYARPPDSPTTTLVGRSDWKGRVTVPPAANPIRVLMLKNGGALLARLPIVPGLQPTFVAEIPDDDVRLEVEGIITGLQEELVDLVTQREILMQRIKTKLERVELADEEASKPLLAEASELLDELDRIPKADVFSRRLRTEKEKIVKKLTDKHTTKKVEDLFGDTEKAAVQFLGRKKIEALWDAYRQARSNAEKGKGEESS